MDVIKHTILPCQDKKDQLTKAANLSRWYGSAISGSKRHWRFGWYLVLHWVAEGQNARVCTKSTRLKDAQSTLYPWRSVSKKKHLSYITLAIVLDRYLPV